MSEPWLEIGDEELDAQELQRRIEDRMARRVTTEIGQECEDGQGPDVRQQEHVADTALPPQEAACDAVARWLQDCDIVPANYVIDWRVPIIGQIHAVVRRVIYAEIRRCLLPALVKQSHLNRAVLQALAELCQENARLSGELEQARLALAQLRQDQERDG